MKKSVVYGCERDSAERVVAHAAWQRSRGRKPSMSFIGEKNPRRALALATAVVGAVKFSGLVTTAGSAIVRGRSYEEMSDDEIACAAKNIIRTSSSEAEVRTRIIDELGYRDCFALTIDLPDDEIGREARELVRGLGGLVMKNGAMAMAMLYGHDDIIHL